MKFPCQSQQAEPRVARAACIHAVNVNMARKNAGMVRMVVAHYGDMDFESAAIHHLCNGGQNPLRPAGDEPRDHYEYSAT